MKNGNLDQKVVEDSTRLMKELENLVRGYLKKKNVFNLGHYNVPICIKLSLTESSIIKLSSNVGKINSTKKANLPDLRVPLSEESWKKLMEYPFSVKDFQRAFYQMLKIMISNPSKVISNFQIEEIAKKHNMDEYSLMIPLKNFLLRKFSISISCIDLTTARKGRNLKKDYTLYYNNIL